MKKKEFKTGDLVTIKSFDPDSAWHGNAHLIGIVYEKVGGRMHYSEAAGMHYLVPVNKDYFGSTIDDLHYPIRVSALCTLEHLL